MYKFQLNCAIAIIVAICKKKRRLFSRKSSFSRGSCEMRYISFIGLFCFKLSFNYYIPCDSCENSSESSYFNRKYRLIRLLFAYSIFKNIEILYDQGVVQIKPNSVWSIPCVCGV